MAPAEVALLNIEVVYCPRPGVTDSVHVQLPVPASIAQALQASGLLQRHRLDLAQLRVGIWNKVHAADFPLRDGDRVEAYRTLTVDPKEARRLRYKRHREAAKSNLAGRS